MASTSAKFLITADDRTRATFTAVERRLNDLSVVAGRSALAIGAIGAAMAGATIKAVNSADAIAKNARAAGFASDAYQELIFAGSQLGIQQESMGSSLERFTKSIGETAAGTGEAGRYFELLGVSVRDAAGNVRSSDEVFRDVAEALGRIESPAERAAAAAQLFGRTGGARMAAALADGVGAVDDLRAKARELGLVLDQDLLTQAEGAADQLDRMQRIAGAQATIALSQLFPVVIGLGNAFAELAPRVREFFDVMNSGSELSMFAQVAELDAEIDLVEKRMKGIPQSSAAGEAAAGAGGFLGTTSSDLLASVAPVEAQNKRLEELVAQRRDLLDRIQEMRNVNRLNEEGLTPDGADGVANTEEKEREKTERLVEAQRRRFDALREQALESQGLDEEAEIARFDLEMQRLEEQNQLIRESEQLTALEKAEFQQEAREAEEAASLAHAARLASIEERRAAKQAQVEKQLQTTITGFRQQAVQQGIALLATFAGESKAAAIALLAIEKGVAIADVLIRGQQAAMLARATIPFPAGEAIAAKMIAHSAISAGLIAATGIAQGVAGGSGGGGGGGSISGGGSFGFGGQGAPPALPNPATQVREGDTNAASNELVLRIEMASGDALSEAIMDSIAMEVLEGDRVIIPQGSRQALELGGS